LIHETILDGTVRPINDEFGYVGELFEDCDSYLHVKELEKKLLKEYIKYLIKSNPDKVCDIVANSYLYNIPEKVSIIYRPAWLVGTLAQRAQLVVKFKREDSDCLLYLKDQTNECDH